MTDKDNEPGISPVLGIAAVAAAAPYVQMAVDAAHTLLGQRHDGADFGKATPASDQETR